MGNGSTKSTTTVCSFTNDEQNKSSQDSQVKTNKSNGAAPSSGGERRLSLKRGSCKVGPAAPEEEKSTPSSNNNHDVNNDETSNTGQLESENIADGYISCIQLYNVMVDGQNIPYLFDPKYLLLVDTRTLERYEQSHIATSIHYSNLENSYMIGCLADYVHIVLYSDEGQVGLDDVGLSDVQQKFISSGVESSVLIGGFDQFKAKFPFVCTSEFIHSEQDREIKLTIYPSIILDNCLYQGRGDQATNSKVISDLNISHIVNLGQEHECAFPDKIEYLSIKVDDESSSDLFSKIPRIVTFIESAVAGNGRILVHCNVGVSRSSTATIAYLMHSRKCTLQDAHDFVKNQRPICKPNRGFLKQLSKYEVNLFGKQITDIDNIWL